MRFLSNRDESDIDYNEVEKSVSSSNAARSHHAKKSSSGNRNNLFQKTHLTDISAEFEQKKGLFFPHDMIGKQYNIREKKLILTWDYPMDQRLQSVLIREYHAKNRHIVYNGYKVTAFVSHAFRNEDEPYYVLKSNTVQPGDNYEIVKNQMRDSARGFNDELKDVLNLDWYLKGQVTAETSPGKAILIVKSDHKIIDHLTCLHEFFSKDDYQDMARSVPDLKLRCRLRYVIIRLLSLLTDKLIAAALEPISIKIDCDKNKYPDIIDSLKDKRNWVQDPNELIENKDNVFFTPTFLPMFDLKAIYDSSYLGLRVKFNAVQLGFRLCNLLTGRFDPRN